MQEEIALNEMMDDEHFNELERLLNEDAPCVVTSADAPRRSPLQILRAAGNFLYNLFDNHEFLAPFVCAVVIVGSLYGSVSAALAIWHHNGKVQAVERAKKMDGEVYSIVDGNWNLVGDTVLYLEDERGDCMKVVMSMNNPFTNEIHPLFRRFSNKRYEPLHLPMKVRVHYRPDAWTDEYWQTKYENYTCSFLTIERFDH